MGAATSGVYTPQSALVLHATQPPHNGMQYFRPTSVQTVASCVCTQLPPLHLSIVQSIESSQFTSLQQAFGVYTHFPPLHVLVVQESLSSHWSAELHSGAGPHEPSAWQTWPLPWQITRLQLPPVHLGVVQANPSSSGHWSTVQHSAHVPVPSQHVLPSAAQVSVYSH